MVARFIKKIRRFTKEKFISLQNMNFAYSLSEVVNGLLSHIKYENRP